MEIIGLSGYARTGKDEAAKVLVDEFGFTRVAFADKLREVLYQLNPVVAFTKQYKTPLYLQDIITVHTWDGYKQTHFKDEIRRLLQRLGTEAGRNTIGEDVWVDAAFNTDAQKIVVTDVRFPNEARAIKARGGSVWRINRQGVGPINSHPSETGLDTWAFDKWLENNGTLDRWKAYVGNVYTKRNSVYASGN